MTQLLNAIYWYCTDFCVNAANLFGITYVEFNFILFVVIYPLLLLFLIAVNVNRYLLKSNRKNKRSQ